MSEMENKLKLILTEIEPKKHHIPRKTADEIAQIFLEQNPAVEPIAQNVVQPKKQQDEVVPARPTYQIDMENMLRSIDGANSKWCIPYHTTLYSCRKGIGKIIVFSKKVFRKLAKFLVEPIVEKQNTFNASSVASLNALRNNDLVFDAWCKSLEASLNTLKDSNLEFDAQCKSLEVLLTEKEQQIQSLNQQLAVLKAAAEETKCIQALRKEVAKLLEAEQSRAAFEKAQHEIDVYGSIDYADFEDYFRGERTEIKKDQSQYVQYYQNCSIVVDLGCGRGEFIELLREQKIDCTGVDSYGPFVDYCRLQNMNVVQSDALTYIRNQPSESIDGVFSSQLIEHISAAELVCLCKESFRILKPGGVVILETPNPMCISTFLNSFYLDPSHKQPIHPKALEYYMKKAGFDDVQLLFTESSKAGYRLPLLDSEARNLEEFNDGINFLSDIIFGSQNFAIIARKR